MQETTLLLIKPDAIDKGLVSLILDAIAKQSLVIVSSVRTKLSQKDIEFLYPELMSLPFFPDLLSFLRSAPIILMKLAGEEAVHKVKFRIIGKYGSEYGIRRIHSEDHIKNLAHAPETLQQAGKELAYFKKYFKEQEEMNKAKFKNRMVFALTGMSECGKSTVGRYFASNNIARVKISRIFDAVRRKSSSAKALEDFIANEEERDALALWDAFIEELFWEMENSAMKQVSIASLYGGGLGPYLQQQLGESFCLIFIDVPEKIRLQRQMIREDLAGIDQAKSLLLPRDEFKIKTGVPALREIANEIVDNSGTIKELHGQIDRIIAKYCR